MWSHSRLSISRRRVPGPRAASASVAISTHSRGPPYPRAARTLFLTHLLACHVPDRAPFSLQTPVERSERLAGGWAVRARAHPLSLEVWHFTLRFVLPWSWVGHPSATAAERRGWVMQSPSGPKVYPKALGAQQRHAPACAVVRIVWRPRPVVPGLSTGFVGPSPKKTRTLNKKKEKKIE